MCGKKKHGQVPRGIVARSLPALIHKVVQFLWRIPWSVCGRETERWLDDGLRWNLPAETRTVLRFVPL